MTNLSFFVFHRKIDGYILMNDARLSHILFTNNQLFFSIHQGKAIYHRILNNFLTLKSAIIIRLFFSCLFIRLDR